ncbi:hypothetical protein V5O48_004599 [Marasmius crinis-equi]|uniref:Uncharacterized protein n=1 Tax=Marasmius crinis-equi TaxID=585013 RepID=A0ABR3FQ51_9AGAR
MSSSPSKRPRRKKTAPLVIPDDIIFAICALAIRSDRFGTPTSVLLVKSSVTPMLYSALYEEITIFEQKSLSTLISTLTIYPRRAKYVRSLFIRVGVLSSTPFHTSDRIPLDVYTKTRQAPLKSDDLARVVGLIKDCSSSLTRLVVEGQPRHELRYFFITCPFPELEELQIPGTALLPPSSWIVAHVPYTLHAAWKRSRLFPRLQRLHLVYFRDQTHTWGLQYIDLTTIPSLNQAHISFCDFLTHEVVYNASHVDLGNVECVVVEHENGDYVSFDDADVQVARLEHRVLFLSSQPAFGDRAWVYVPSEDDDFWRTPLARCQARAVLENVDIENLE